MPTLTPEQARNGARRSAEVRRGQKIELLALRARVKEFESALPAKPPEQPKDNIPEMLTRTRDQLDQIDKLLAECSDPREWDALTRSRERNFRIWAHLAGIPGPGNLKPSAVPKASKRALAEPTVPASMPDTPSPSVPQAQPSPGTPQDAQETKP